MQAINLLKSLVHVKTQLMVKQFPNSYYSKVPFEIRYIGILYRDIVCELVCNIKVVHLRRNRGRPVIKGIGVILVQLLGTNPTNIILSLENLWNHGFV